MSQRVCRVQLAGVLDRELRFVHGIRFHWFFAVLKGGLRFGKKMEVRKYQTARRAPFSYLHFLTSIFLPPFSYLHPSSYLRVLMHTIMRCVIQRVRQSFRHLLVCE